jgi:hypothetical protein
VQIAQAKRGVDVFRIERSENDVGHRLEYARENEHVASRSIAST